MVSPNVAVAAVALLLRGAELESFAARLVRRVQVVEDGDDEGLGAASIGESERALDRDPLAIRHDDVKSLEVAISKQGEGCLMVIAYGDTRNPDANDINDPLVEFVIVLRTVVLQPPSKGSGATDLIPQLRLVH